MAEEAEEEGREIPSAIATRPELDDFLSRVMEAFYLLSPSRSMVLGLETSRTMPLAVADIMAVADACGIERLYFLRVTRTLDSVYLAFVNKTD